MDLESSEQNGEINLWHDPKANFHGCVCAQKPDVELKVARLLSESKTKTNAALYDLAEKLVEALEGYAWCEGEDCTCGDGWDHRHAIDALALARSMGIGEKK